MFDWMRDVPPMPFIVAALLVASANDTRADAPVGQYIISNGTVFDTKTELLWEQNPTISLYTWNDAKAHCQNLSLMGTGWRLPSMKELQTIVDESRVDPSIDVTAFPNTALEKYWTSTIRAAYVTDAWLVAFDYGGTSRESMGLAFRARCVR